MSGCKESGGYLLFRKTDVGCIACGGFLYFLPDSYPLAFRCQIGHFLTLKDLLDQLLLPEKGASLRPVKWWESKALLLHRLAGRALKSGHALSAADFQDAASRIDQWASALQVLLPKS